MRDVLEAGAAPDRLTLSTDTNILNSSDLHIDSDSQIGFHGCSVARTRRLSDVEVENAMGIQLPDDVRLKGVFKPMRFEATVEDCIVTYGEIPKDLTGGFYRNGPTWKRPTAQGTIGLLGIDGMVQGLIFEDGRADFRNRWIRTPKYVLEDKYGRGLFE
jgi:Retinal pigment epithelial membrane protein